MAKTIDNAKKRLENFTNNIKRSSKLSGGKKMLPIDLTRNLDRESKSFSDRYKGSYSFDTKNTEPSGIADLGINEDSINNQVLYNSDLSNTKGIKKFRRISANNKPSINNGKILSNLYSQNAKLMTKLHSDNMAMTQKYHSMSLQHMTEMTNQVKQITHVKNTIELDYYKQSLTNQTALLEEVKNISNILKAGFNLNDRQERVADPEKTSLIKGLFSGNGSFSGRAGNVMKTLAKDAVKEHTGMVGLAVGMLPMVYGMARQQGGLSAMLQGAVKERIFSGAMDTVLGNGRTGRRAKHAISDPGEFFENLMNTWALTQGGAKGWLGKKLGNSKKMEGIDLSKYLRTGNKERSNFDQAAHTALTRVITRSLANIESALTGQVAKYYNYETNRFETLKEANSKLTKGYSEGVQAQFKNLRKSLMDEREITDKKGKKKMTYGIFSNIEVLAKSATDQQTKVVAQMIKTRGNELVNGMMKLISHFSRNGVDPSVVLQEADFSVEMLMNILYPREMLNDHRMDINKLAEGAMAFKIFLEKFRELPSKEGQELWNDLLYRSDAIRSELVNHLDKSIKDAEGSVAQWNVYNQGGIKAIAGKSSKDIERAMYEAQKNYGITGLEDVVVDLTGVVDPDEMTRRIRQQFNRMMEPLFKGPVEVIKNNLNNKAKELKRADHFFAPYVEKAAKAFEKSGDSAFINVDYAEAAGINNYEDLINHKRSTSFNKYDPINSAKEVAKWHLQNPKIKGMIGAGSAIGYATLIKTMYEKSGMTGPIASAIIGISAASGAVLSGKMGKTLSVFTSSVGQEMMKDKEGNETNITKQQAMQEAMYREFLPKSMGMMAGAKIGAWIKSNVRFGPILGPAVGLMSGWLLGKTSGWVMKLGGLIGKMGKNVLNWLGNKVTGDATSKWGDRTRDALRKYTGMGDGSHKFTMKEVLDQIGPENATGKDYALMQMTGQNIDDISKRNVKMDFADEYYRKRLMFEMKNGKVLNDNIKPTNTTNVSNFEDNFFDNSNDVNEPAVMNVKVIGGHLDAIGVVGMIDNKSYISKVRSMQKAANEMTSSEKRSTDKKNIAKESFIKNTSLAENFMKQDNQAKDEVKDQERQEKIEEQNASALQTISQNGVPSVKNVKKKDEPEKKGGIMSAIGKFLVGDFVGGFGDLFSGFTGGGGMNLAKIGLGAFLLWPAVSKMLGVDKDGKSNGGLLGTAFNGVKSLFGFGAKTADKFYQKREEGDILPDGRISMGIDAMRLGKHAWNRHKKSLVGRALAPVREKMWRKAAGVGTRMLGDAKFYGKLATEKVKDRVAQNLGEDSVKIIGKEVAKDTVTESTQAIIKQATKSGEVSKIGGFLMKVLDKSEALLMKIPGMEKITSKIVGNFIPAIKKVFQELLEKISGKLLKEGTEKAAKRGVMSMIKQGITAGGVTAWINIGFIAWDAWQGRKKAKDYFGISEDDRPTMVQQWACAITYGLLSMIEAVPGCGIVAMIVSALDPIMKWLCQRVYEMLDSSLDMIGLGDNSTEEEEYAILINGGDIDPRTGQKYASKDDAMKNSEQINNYTTDENGNIVESNSSANASSDEITTKFRDYTMQVGGSGTGYDTQGNYIGTMIRGSELKETNAPSFYNQDNFPYVKFGSINSQDDGCGPAVMKMIASYKGMKISDEQLIMTMRKYILSNKTISISYFSEFGAHISENKAEIKMALKDPKVAMAVLSKNGGTYHFIAIIGKDRSSVYVGDPLKTNWEVISRNDPRILTYATSVAIFSDGFIKSGVSLNVKGGGAGGFGTKAKANTFKVVNNVLNKVGQKASSIVKNIFAGNMSDEELITGNTSTATAGTTGNVNVSEFGVPDIPMPHGNVVEVLDRTKYSGASDENVVRFADGTIAKRKGEIGYRMFNPDSSDKGSKWAERKFGAMATSFNRQFTYPSVNHSTKALIYQLFTPPESGENRINWSEMDIPKMVSTYAPKSVGNNEELYKSTITSMTGLPLTTKMKDVPKEKIGPYINAIRKMEIGADTPEKLIKYFQDGGGKETIIQKGESGADEVQHYGGGTSIGFTTESLQTCFVKQSAVSQVLGLTKQNTTCGIAVALMLSKIIYYGSRNRFDAKTVMNWAKSKNMFDKDLGVSQRFFKGLGMKTMNIDEIKSSLGKHPIVKNFCSISIWDNKKWNLQKGELGAANVEGGHWVLLARALDGKCWVMDPMDDGLADASMSKVGNKKVHYYLTIKDMREFVNILNGARNQHESLDSAQSKGKGNVNATNKGEGGVASTSSDNGENSSADSGTETSTSEDKLTPNRGTSATIGGWYYKDKDGEVKQVFFGSKGSKSSSGEQAQSTATGSTAGPAGPLGLPASCDVMPDAKKEDGGEVSSSSPAYKAGAYAQAHYNGGLQGLCATGVSQSLAAGFGGGRNTGNANDYHARSGVLAKKTNAPHGKGKYPAGGSYGHSDGKSAGYMKKIGYHYISITSKPQVGDVIVYTHPTDPGWIGHIAILCPDGKWRADGLNPGGNFFCYGSAGSPSQSKYTLWRHGGVGGEDNISHDEFVADEMKKRSDTARNASQAMRTHIANSKHDQMLRNETPAQIDKRFGMFQVKIRDVNDAQERSLQTGLNILSDVKSDNQLINALNNLTQLIGQQTLNNKRTNQELVKETEKQIEAIKETKETTKNASKNLEVTSKKQPTIITPPPILDTSSNILALLLNAEKEMFVGVNS